jgi:hypothetical protein
MTLVEARKWAKARWGVKAYVEKAKQGPNRYCVGVRGDPGVMLGYGPTWEAAFVCAGAPLPVAKQVAL